MKDWDIITKSHGELLAELLNIPAEVFTERTLREILETPMTIKGIGEKRAEKIRVLKEISRRWFSEQHRLRVINGPEDVARHLMPKLKGENQEHFMLLALNIHHRLIGTSVVSVGSLSGAVVHPREVFRDAMGYSASAIIVAHNHPSGRPAPSKEDIKVTQHLMLCGDIMEIPVLDHVILGDNLFYSYKENKVGRIKL